MPLSFAEQEPANRYLSGIIRLFALVAGSNGVVTKAELAYVHDYLLSLYPESAASRVFESFQDAAARQENLDEAVRELGGLYSREEKIFLLIKVYELVEAGGFNAVEANMAREIGSRLGLTETDSRALESIFRLRGASTPHFDRQAAILPLRLGDASASSSQADLQLPVPGLDLEVFKVNHVYYVRQRDEAVAVRLGGRPLRRGFTTRIEPGRSLRIGNLEFAYVDLLYYFNCLLGCYSDKTLYLRHEIASDPAASYRSTGVSCYRIDLEDGPNTRLAIELRGLTTRLSTRHDAPLRIDGQLYPVGSSVEVLLNSAVELDGEPIDLRKVVVNSFTDEQPLDLPAEVTAIIVSNGSDADVLIPDGLPMLWRSVLRRNGSGGVIEKENCPHAVYVNRQRIQARAQFGPTDTLDIGNYRLQVDFSAGIARKSRFSVQRFLASKLRHRFRNGGSALDDVSFEINYGEMVCILGPSGCGKSTLLSILNGQQSPTGGRVLVEGFDLHGDGATISRQIGYVPQDDLLLEDLTVFENLAYSARLRAPARSMPEIRALVDGVLHEIGLEEQHDTKVGSPTHKVLSGGQRKRLNIGLELLGDSAVYLLDEPTSGLSSEDSLRIIDLLKHRALAGKILFVVIHQPSAKLFALFDKVILLDRGGRLAFCGATSDALAYFRAENELPEAALGAADDPDVLLKTLEAPLLNIDGTPLAQRRHPPEYWRDKFLDWRRNHVEVKIELANEQGVPPPVRRLGFRDRLRQGITLLTREFFSKVRNRSNLWTTGLVSPLLGLLVGLILRQNGQAGEPYTLANNHAFLSFFFLASIIAIFLALSNSLAEIVRDRPLLLRERMLNIPTGSYVLAKYAMLCLLATVQLAFFLAVAFVVLKVRDCFWGDLSYLALTAAAASALGLVVSALPGLSEKAAANLLPLILVPQIVLAGSEVFEFKQMNHLLLRNWATTSPVVSSPAETANSGREVPEIADWLILSRWSYEGLVVQHQTRSRAQDVFRAQDDLTAWLKRRRNLTEAELPAWEAGHTARKEQVAALQADPSRQSQQNADLNRSVQPYEEARHEFPRFLVSQKKLPLWLGNKVFSTAAYNAGVLALFAIGFLTLTYLLTRWGETAEERLARGVTTWAGKVGQTIRQGIYPRSRERKPSKAMM